tara:strand:- start:302 stop:445 length:144 start_codon:yes stop_codon:yes gene_type:complete
MQASTQEGGCTRTAELRTAEEGYACISDARATYIAITHGQSASIGVA